MNNAHSLNRLSSRNEINMLQAMRASLSFNYDKVKINDNMIVNEGVGIPPPLGQPSARPGVCVVYPAKHRLKNPTRGIDIRSPS